MRRLPVYIVWLSDAAAQFDDPVSGPMMRPVDAGAKSSQIEFHEYPMAPASHSLQIQSAL
jgi:hypothetical protein